MWVKMWVEIWVNGLVWVKIWVKLSCRDSGVILLASGGAGSELLSIWGRSC